VEIFNHIFLNNIAPIFIIIFTGYQLARKFNIDINTLIKITFYIITPALVIVSIYETEIGIDIFNVFLFFSLMLILMSIIGIFLSRVFKYDIAQTNAVKNSIIFFNAGNFGLPLIMLIFRGTPYASFALSVQIMIMLFNTIGTNTLGFYNAGRGQMNFRKLLKKIFSMPVLYSIIIGLILRLIPYNINELFIWSSLNYIKDGMIPISLITLGAQLYHTKCNINDYNVIMTSVVRLVGAPLMAFLLFRLLGFDGALERVLFISIAAPTSVNSALIAIEFKNKPAFASQVVMVSTLLSPFTLTGIIYLSNYI
jgi:hypothetical protein